MRPIADESNSVNRHMSQTQAGTFGALISVPA